MKKIINDATAVVDEMLDGLTYAHGDLVERINESGIIVAKNQTKGHVGLISGGGSGHEPAHAGFVGQGMLSAAVCGAVFTSPTPDQILEGIKAADQGAGVFLIIKNYSGDVMNFDMAKELAEMEDIEVDFIIVDDDIAVEDSTYTAGKRGVAGTVLVHKILGAAADQGASLSEIKAMADKLVPQIKTIGVALTGATVPEVGKPGFVLADDEIEFGVGIHGEPGYRREKIAPSKELAKELVMKLKAAFDWKKGDHFALLVNGLGSTPLMEQYIFTNDVRQLLDEEGIVVEFKKVGDFMTAIDMAGLSLTLVKLEDSKWLENLTYKTNTIAW
ncbi:DhaKLM operon coactivator DhaQ [Carnobacterium divergens]|uniref:DhaKLM operon coactivator DhaQ n=2 Tax=Carnobacterium divergens TaxID=2748 RepID=A0A0R2I6Z3_CARDV|nr:DhaKLM operon coactivator DhaQ [Carnobacterium divergens]ANZ98773.1 dihydroxyacetone kinase subunit DhaK [Carnobacterium divergens]KRN57514.1 PTS-dependent dihydroxyacetone kinase, dihydroxyacetone-binding subunit DhaK [Carnobacterium divergens DSM 20623]MDO0875718.1 DhaKLM operon coactivator DhaQ [Carnobacterium divergens]MDT1958691.1 DhaKLM operon coactivator DhaQ [Carnobacterium divergens]MDT1974571.1 DhaKLM operon coactivator DhaQ [Carnobacterium divergens]